MFRVSYIPFKLSAAATTTATSSSILQLAISSLAQQHNDDETSINNNQSNNNNSNNIKTTTFGVTPSKNTQSPWIDRDAEREQELMEHRRSDEYVELHKAPAKNIEMGLFGGEAGFEKTPRVWVDPDNPHVQNIYTVTPLNINTSYSRYGHFKRELHIIDIDKLCRHARMVPPIDKLMTDLVSARVALDDDQCSALIRHGARALYHLVGYDREHFFSRIEETFERFLISVAPPMYAGPRTHADMIRVCAMCQKWDEGFHQYRQRAVEEAEDSIQAMETRRSNNNNKNINKNKSMISGGKNSSSDALLTTEYDDQLLLLEEEQLQQNNSISTTTSSSLSELDADLLDDNDTLMKRFYKNAYFELTADFYDAVIELCVSCGKHEECIKQLRLLIRSGHRPRLSSLTNALISASALSKKKNRREVGMDIMRLVDFYRRQPDAAYFEARAAFAAQVAPEFIWTNLREALSVAAEGKFRFLASDAYSSSSVSTAPTYAIATPNSHTVASTGRGSKVKVPITSKTISWSLLALSRFEDSVAEDAVKVLNLADSHGIPIDYEHLTFALMLCSSKTSSKTNSSSSSSCPVGEVIFHLLTERAKIARVNITPEITMLALRALSRIDTSQEQLTSEYATLALETISAVEVTNKHSSHFPSIFYSLFQLLARLGAMATFSSCLRKFVLSRGEEVSSWLLRSWLWCNSLADAPNGGHRATEEALQILRLKRGAEGITKEVVVALALCRISHGEFTEKAKKMIENFHLESSIIIGLEKAEQQEQEQQKELEEEEVEEMSLMNLVEECANAITKQLERQEEQQESASSGLFSSSSSSEKNNEKLSLQQVLSATLSSSNDSDNDDENDSKNVNNNNFINVNENIFIESFSEYDACVNISKQIPSMLLRLVDSSSSSSSSSNDKEDTKKIAADIFQGLVSEYDENPVLMDSIAIEEFEATPSTLRELRVKWTMEISDIHLRRFGQRNPSANSWDRSYSVNTHVQPFGGNA